MSEWPIQIVKHADTRAVDSVPPGEPVTFIRFAGGKAGSGAGKEVIGYIALCPKCGTFGSCNLKEFSEPGRGWTADEENGLTMRPSILCKCGGHYFATNGVLREC